MESTNEMTTITDGWVYVTDVTYCWTKYWKLRLTAAAADCLYLPAI